MNISLTPEFERLVNDKVKTGLYQTASEVIREGLRLLRERDQRVEALRRDVRVGLEAVERGEFTDHDEGISGNSQTVSRPEVASV
jgi:antitoxin ParD1/3/4